MVEAIRVSLPFSINSNRLCCCFLLKYWISSRYSKIPPGASRVPTSAIMSLISCRDAVVALSRYRVLLVFSAMMLATVVFPVPEGP